MNFIEKQESYIRRLIWLATVIFNFGLLYYLTRNQILSAFLAWFVWNFIYFNWIDNQPHYKTENDPNKKI